MTGGGCERVGNARDGRPETGFTLLEVVISIAIIAVITLSVASILRSSYGIRTTLSDRSKINHRLANAMERLVSDLQHAYIVPTTDTERNGEGRRQKGIFQIDTTGDQYRLRFTTMAHRSRFKNSAEGDATFVVYELKDNPQTPGRMDLTRSESPRVPEDFRDNPGAAPLARWIKRLEVKPWTGDDWSKDRWDSSRSDWRNKMPRMVQVTLEAWDEEPPPMDAPAEVNAGPWSDDAPTVTLNTVVYLPYAQVFPELKSQVTSIRWF